jgi:hypothetical protein
MPEATALHRKAPSPDNLNRERSHFNSTLSISATNRPLSSARMAATTLNTVSM